MTRPKVYRDLFDNDGAGPKLKEDILPDNAVGSGYLPLSGGTMTENIAFNFGTGDIRRDTDDGVLELWGGATTYGGKIALFGTSNANHPGEFRLYSNAGSSSSTYVLAGGTDGLLGWNGKIVLNGGDAGGGLRRSVQTDTLEIWGGTTTYSGKLLLGGETNSSYPSSFRLYSYNNTTPYVLYGKPDGTLTWSGTFKGSTLQATSDIRKKKDIKEFAPDLSSIKSYEYTLDDDGKRHVGLIAQEVEKVIPTAISEDDKGMKSLDYNSVVAALVAEVNQLKKEIKELKGE